MVKIAVTSEGNGMEGSICMHFGHCPEFVVIDADGEEVKSVKAVQNPYLGHHIPGALPKFVKELEAEVLIAGGIGSRAIDVFNSLGIKVVFGASGKVGDAVSDYLHGKLKEGENICTH